MKKLNNWRRDKLDNRDHLYKVTEVNELPSKVDLRDLCSPVEDQGELGSCTGNAIVGALEIRERKLKKRQTNLSRLFVYYNERVMEGTVTEDAGAEIRDGIKSVADLGACRETLCKYDVSRFTRKPSKSAYTDAAKRKITEYQRVTNFADLKHSLANSNPVVFGFEVFASFMSDAVAANGKMPMPQASEASEGGHAVLAVGYDDEIQCVIVRNSWGTNWGDKGYFYMPYAYIQNQSWCDDMWAIT